VRPPTSCVVAGHSHIAALGVPISNPRARLASNADAMRKRSQPIADDECEAAALGR
jgi:hypothetical protein